MQDASTLYEAEKYISVLMKSRDHHQHQLLLVAPFDRWRYRGTPCEMLLLSMKTLKKCKYFWRNPSISEEIQSATIDNFSDRSMVY